MMGTLKLKLLYNSPILIKSTFFYKYYDGFSRSSFPSQLYDHDDCHSEPINL